MFSRHKKSRASETLLPGQMSYLKKRAEYNDQDLLRVDLSDGCFDHLVLILSIDTQEAQVEALIVSHCQILENYIFVGTNHSCSLRLSGG